MNLYWEIDESGRRTDCFLHKDRVFFVQSFKVGDALLRSQWYRFDVKFQRLIVIALSNTQKSLVITGGKFFNLGWDLFVTVS